MTVALDSAQASGAALFVQIQKVRSGLLDGSTSRPDLEHYSKDTPLDHTSLLDRHKHVPNSSCPILRISHLKWRCAIEQRMWRRQPVTYVDL